MQFVEYGGEKSELLKILTGVPQGSCLAPTLFLIYINDFADAISLKSILFADDTTIMHSDGNLVGLKSTVQTGLNEASAWFIANYLEVNPSKTRFILFNTEQDILLELNGMPLEQIGKKHKEKSYKMLGFVINEQMDWKEHTNMVRKKLLAGIFNLNRAKHYITIGTRKLLYNALIKSHMEYGLSIWGKNNTKNLTKIQKRAVRSIEPGKIHTARLFKEHGLLKIDDLFKYATQVEAKKIQLKLGPKWNENLLVGVKNNRRSATKKLVQVPRGGYRSIQSNICIPMLWNDLPIELKEIKKISLFKKTPSTVLFGAI
jgi:hypothetical protein